MGVAFPTGLGHKLKSIKSLSVSETAVVAGVRIRVPASEAVSP